MNEGNAADWLDLERATAFMLTMTGNFCHVSGRLAELTAIGLTIGNTAVTGRMGAFLNLGCHSCGASGWVASNSITIGDLK